MDQFKKRGLSADNPGRMLRNMSLQWMTPILDAGSWLPAVDVYETRDAIIVCMDVSGGDPRKLSVVAEEQLVTVSGERQRPSLAEVSSIHQLEIERGFFERAIPLPRAVDVSRVSSEYQHGFLVIILPLQRRQGKIRIRIA